MIKFHCGTCGKKIGVPYEYAGKRVKCPGCANPVQVPEPEPEPVVDLAAEPGGEGIWTNDMLSQPEPAVSREEVSPINICPQCKSPLGPDTHRCPVCDQLIKEEPVAAAKSVVGSSFWRDLIGLLCPVRNLGDGVTFFFVLIISIYAGLNLPGIFFLISKILASGYICAFLFSVLLETANGEDNLPSLPAVTEQWNDIIRPLLLFIGSVIYAFLPTIGLFILHVVSFGFVALNDDWQMLVKITFFAGVFFWPMIILSIALGDTIALKPHLIIMSIVRAFGPYLVCCLCIYAASFLWILSPNIAGLSDGLSGIILFYLLMQIGGLWSLYPDLRDAGNGAALSIPQRET